MYKAVLFDLDGVITDTAPLHFKAWLNLAKKLGGSIDEAFNENLKGVDRQESLRRVLKEINITLTEAEFEKALIAKNTEYVKSLDALSEKDILPGIKNFLEELKTAGLKIIIASASKNAPAIIKKLNLDSYVDAIACPSKIKANKPAPDIFLLAAKLGGAEPHEAIGIEDAQAGIDALNSAGIDSVAIGSSLEGATTTLASTGELNISLLER